jgi:hypothetical protein
MTHRNKLFLMAGFFAAMTPRLRASVTAADFTINLTDAVLGHVLYTSAGTYTQGVATTSVDLLPSLTLDGDVTATPVRSGSINEFARYYFEYSGPAGTTVPILIHASLSSTVAGGNPSQAAISRAGITIFDDGNNVVDGRSTDCNLSFGCSSDQYDGIIPLSVDANREYSIRLNVFLSAAAGNAVHGIADPQISIDPGFLNGGLYTFDISSGVGNSLTAAPEPSTWMAGVAALGLVLRRRLRRLPPPTL